MTDIAIIISTFREASYLNNIIQRVLTIPNTRNYSYKFYVSTFNNNVEIVDNEKIKVIKDEGKGSANSYNLLVKESKEDFVLTLTDCTLPPDNFFDIIPLIDSLKFKLSSFTSGGGAHCFVPHPRARAMIMRFPALHRSVINNYLDGVLFNESFKHHWMDNWLAMWTTLIGCNSAESEICLQDVPHSSRGEHDNFDKDIFYRLVDNFDTNRSYNASV